MGKKKAEKIDGLGPRELQQISSAIRLVWQRSRARLLCVKRATGKDGFFRCENKTCKKKVPKIHVDHIEAAGSIREADFIKKLFCPSSGLQALCKDCHKVKTKEERRLAQANLDFF